MPIITQGPEHKAQSYTLRAQLPPATLTHSSYPHWHRHTHIFTQSHMIPHPRHSHPPNIHTDSICSLPSPETWVVSFPTGHLCPVCNRGFEIVLQVPTLQEREGTRRDIYHRNTALHPQGNPPKSDLSDGRVLSLSHSTPNSAGLEKSYPVP